ncbi:MAG: glycosyltransferase family 4 protein [Acidobacteriota bacterium]
MRVAYLSPLPPRPSGIADYSAELLPELARRWAVDVYTEADYRPAAPWEEAPSVAEFRRRAGDYDAVVYQIGNHPHFHGALYDCALEIPGTVVLHEVVLHHMVRERTVVAGNIAAYLETLRYCCGPTGYRLGRRMVTSGLPVDPFRYPLFERLVDRSRGVIVHSEAARRRILASRPAAAVEVVRQHFHLRPEETAGEAGGKAGARQQLDLDPDTLVVATFGFLSRPKRIEICLRAFQRLRRAHPEALFVLAGDADPQLDLDRLLAGELGCGVRWLGRTPMADFQRWMRAADIALNLRHPTAGETSAALMRLLALGKAVVVSDGGSFAEIPEGCCFKVEPGAGEVELIARALVLLAADRDLRRRLGRNARRYMAEAHTVGHAADAYGTALERFGSRPAAPFRPRPPLLSYPVADLDSEWFERIGRHLADLGIEEGQEDLIAGVCEHLVELGARAEPEVGED